MSSEHISIKGLSNNIIGLRITDESADFDPEESVCEDSSVVKNSDIDQITVEATFVKKEEVRVSDENEKSIVEAIPELESHLLGLVLDGEKKDNTGAETQEESLLPPLPEVVVRRTSGSQEERMASFASISSSEGSSDVSTPDFRMMTEDVDQSFDLSKALEIPINFSFESSVNKSLSNQNLSSHFTKPFTSSVTLTPKTSLKRRFSNTLLSQAFHQDGTYAGIASVQSFSPNTDVSLHKTSTRSSGHTSSSSSVIKRKSRSNSNIPLNSPLENHSFIGNIGNGHPSSNRNTLTNENSAIPLELFNGTRKPDLKKNTIDQSLEESGLSSSMQSFLAKNLSSNLNPPLPEEMLYKPPSALTSLNSHKINRSRSSSNTKFVANTMSPHTRDSLENSYDSQSQTSGEIHIPKRAPLLRWASTSILRKRSIRQNNEVDSPIASSSINTRISSLDLDVIGKPDPGITKCSFIDIERKFSSSSTRTDPSRGTRSASPALKSSNIDTTILRQPSFGSMVRRGLTRIISGTGSSRKQEIQKVSDYSLPSPTDADLISSNFSTDLNSLKDFVEEHTDHRHHLLRRRSSSFIQKYPSQAGKNGSNSNSIGSGRIFSNSLSNRNKSVMSNENSDINGADMLISGAEIEEWSKELPTITITERFGAKNTTSLQCQSNVWFYKVGFEEWKNTNNTYPSKATLKQYINLLVEQQMKEDARFAALEKNFKESGWVSNSDLSNLRQKRIIISAQWAERISFYENKLEEL